MDTETQQIYTTTMSIADKIDRDLFKKNLSHESVKELLRMDLRNFLIFLIVADRIVAKDEIHYINHSLGYNFDAMTLKSFISNSNIMQDDFLNKPPASMKYFLDYGKNDFVVHESKYYDLKKMYILTFQSLGEDFLSRRKQIDTAEINQLTRYRFMLESKANAYLKSGGVAPSRPDSIPFRLKSKTEEEIEETEHLEETSFIGNISGGDKTIDDLDTLLNKLNDLIGLNSVKTEVNDLINLLKIIDLRKKNGLKVPPITKHFVFTGNPGTGKTTVARLLAEIYCSLGVLSKGHLVEVDRSGMVAAYMGQTAIKVKEVVEKAKGGVLFIDEAYALANETPGGDFGQEAIDTLVKAMEDNRNDLIVIVAGYPDLMNKFINTNPGLKSRFQKVIHFPDYDASDLYKIFLKNCKDNDYELSPDASSYLLTQLTEYTKHKTKNFGNARDIRNFLDIAISAQANRLLKENATTPEALVTLTAADLSEIFNCSKPNDFTKNM